MQQDIRKVLTEIEENIDALDEEFPSDKVIDLKLKYVIAQALVAININLYEISHYGIGTD